MCDFYAYDASRSAKVAACKIAVRARRSNKCPRPSASSLAAYTDHACAWPRKTVKPHLAPKTDKRDRPEAPFPAACGGPAAYEPPFAWPACLCVRTQSGVSAGLRPTRCGKGFRRMRRRARASLISLAISGFPRL